MKKLLSGCTLATVLLLSACSNSGITTCTNVNGETINAYHENGEITSLVMTEIEDISDYDDGTIDILTATFDAMPEATYAIDDDILTLTLTLEGEAIQAMIPGVVLDLDEFITNSEADGATCE